MENLKLYIFLVFCAICFTINAQNTSILITEFMSNPDCVNDSQGEWFELYNSGDSAIDINGWRIVDNGSNSHIISTVGPLFVYPDSFLVLGNNNLLTTNGGYNCNYEYSSFTLSNTSDAIIIVDTFGNTIDSVSYGSGTNISSPGAGVSKVFIGCSFDDNNLGSNWGNAQFQESTYIASCTDLGSPGSKGAQQIIKPKLQIFTENRVCEGEPLTFYSNVSDETVFWYGDSSLSVFLDSGSVFQTASQNLGLYNIWLAYPFNCVINDVKASVEIVAKSDTLIQVTTCDSYASPSGNQIWTSTGIYSDTIQNNKGCDSIIHVDLSIINSVSSQIFVTQCFPLTSPSGNFIWDSTGSYLDTLTNYLGCDSLITVHLTILNSSSSRSTITACDTYLSPSGNTIWNTSGNYSDTLLNSNGCDSIINMDLTINYSSFSFLTDTTCLVYFSVSGNYNWTTSGVYSDTIANFQGCDSIISLDLTIVDIDSSLSQFGDTLVSNENNASYQWFDCNTSAPIPGEVNNIFVANANGDYAVIVDNGFCQDTSDCRNITKLGFAERNEIDIKVFPQPTKGILIIESERRIVKIRVFDANSKLVQVENEDKNEIDLSALESGIYLIEISTDLGKQTKKIILNHTFH